MKKLIEDPKKTKIIQALADSLNRHCADEQEVINTLEAMNNFNDFMEAQSMRDNQIILDVLTLKEIVAENSSGPYCETAELISDAFIKSMVLSSKYKKGIKILINVLNE